MSDLKFINISDSKRKLLDDLDSKILVAKRDREHLIYQLQKLEIIIQETQEIVNELMGLPLKIS